MLILISHFPMIEKEMDMMEYENLYGLISHIQIILIEKIKIEVLIILPFLIVDSLINIGALPMELKIMKQQEIEQLYYIIGGTKMLEDVLNWGMVYPYIYNNYY